MTTDPMNQFDFEPPAQPQEESWVPDSIFEVPQTNNETIIQTEPKQNQSQPEDSNIQDARRFLEWLDLSSYTFCWAVNHEFERNEAKTYSSIKDALRFCNRTNECEEITAAWVHVNPATSAARRNHKLNNSEISERKFIVLDMDGDKGYNPTDADKESVCLFVLEILLGDGFRGIATADSGNGCLMLPKIDAPTKDGFEGKQGYIQRYYNYINEKLAANGFGHWSIDPKCKNADRIVGVPGTWNFNNIKTTAPKLRKLMGILEGDPMPAAKFTELVDRASPVKPKTAPSNPSVKSPSQSIPTGDMPKDLFWALWFKRFGDDGIAAVEAALIEGGFTVIGPDNSGDGVLFESAYRSAYTTPSQDTDCCVYPGMGYSFMHSTDSASYSWDGALGFAQQYLPIFMAEYSSELQSNQERAAAKAKTTGSNSTDPSTAKPFLQTIDLKSMGIMSEEQL